MAEKQDLYYESRDGKTRIHGVIWKPDCMLGEQPAKPKCVLQIVHGMEEYIDRYDEFARFLNKYDICVIGNDHLGHGQSVSDEVVHGYFGMDDIATVVVRDVHRLKKMVQETLPEVPFFIMGHSMGSFILRNYLFRYGTGIQGAIICGTGSQSPALIKFCKAFAGIQGAVSGQKHVAKMLDKMAFGNYNRKIAEPKTGFDWLCRDEKVVDAYIRDPLCGFTFTVNGFKTLFTLIDRLNRSENLQNMPKELPVYFIAGDKDPVGNYGEGVKKAYESFRNAGMERITLKLYSEDRHEILNELDKYQIYEALYSWIVDRVKEYQI